MVEPFLTNDFVRGAVSGLGLVNLLAGFVEIWSFLTDTPRAGPDRLDQPRPAPEDR